MCGISAIISKNGFSFRSLQKMTDIIRHRGPDGAGYVCFSAEQVDIVADKDTPEAVINFTGNYHPKNRDIPEYLYKVGFGHRRLSIIDLSEAGHQPMCDQTGKFWIIFNGEIFNYLEIKKELQTEGISFQTDTDTEVILESYKKWGIKCQEKFNGMWAFIIYDRQHNEIFVSRDRFGIKPLYFYTTKNDELYFCSEIKQLTTVSGWESKLNHDMAYDYLYHSLTDHTMATMFKGVFRIKPGHCLKSSVDNLNLFSNPASLQSEWFHFSDENFQGDFNTACNTFKEHFYAAIELHARADVEVGSALSGGLDSSAIVSCLNSFLKKQGKESQQKTFSSCSPDKRYDEKEWMDEVVSHTGVEAFFVFPEGRDVFNLTDKIIWHMDEPYQSQSAFLGFHVFQKAREKNVIVLLNGQGADEYLSGYTDYRSLRLMNTFIGGNIRTFVKEMKSLGADFPGMIRFLISGFITRWNLKKIPFLNSKKLLNPHLARIIDGNVLVSKVNHLYGSVNYTKKSVKEISAHQINIEPLQKYLRWEDRNSMAHSVEARVPFLDVRLVEFARSLPLSFLDGPGETKKILVSSLKDILPSKIAARKDKKGFITPEESWFTADYKNEFIQLFRENIAYAKGIIKEREAEIYLQKVQNGTIPFDYTYWRIILFCIWMRRFEVSL